MKIQLFLVLAIYSLDMRLQTQVLDSGHVAILGVDKFNREVMRFLISVKESDSFEQSELNGDQRGPGWRKVDSYSDADDITSQSCITPSKMTA